jgi:hypothetical protein
MTNAAAPVAVGKSVPPLAGFVLAPPQAIVRTAPPQGATAPRRLGLARPIWWARAVSQISRMPFKLACPPLPTMM